MVGLPSETHLKFYQVDIEDFDNEVYSYEVEARNDEEAALKAEDTRQVRDVCIFRIMKWKYSFESGELSVESFNFHIPINFFCLNMLYNCTTFLTFATWLEKLSHLRIIIATLWRS